MKKILIFLSFVSLLTLAPSVKAVSPFGSTKSAEIQERFENRKLLLEQKKEEIKERIEQKRATRQAQLTEKRRERIRSFFNRLVQRINAAIDRLDQLINRIESRLGKIEDEEIDVASIQEVVDEAKALLDVSKASLAATQDSLEDVLSNEDPKEAFEVVRATIKDIKNNLQEVHQLLVHVIGDIKGLRVGNN